MPLEYLMWAPVVALSLLLYVTLAIGALFSLVNSGWVSSSSRRGWAAAVILLPVAGAVLWLAASHRHNIMDGIVGNIVGDDSAGTLQPAPDGPTLPPDQQTSA